MKILPVLFVSVLLGAASFTHAQSADGPELDVYSYYIPGLINSETEGSLVDMLDRIVELSGLNFKLNIVPTRRAQTSFKQGTILSYFPEIEEHRSYPSCRTSNILEKQIIVFTRKDDPRITDIEDLHGKKVGAVSGYSYGTEITKNREIQIEYTDNDDINLKKLLAGRIDAIVGDIHSTINAVNLNELNDQVYFNADEPINVLDVFFLFQDDEQGQQYCKKVSDALITLKEEGALFTWFGYK